MHPMKQAPGRFFDEPAFREYVRMMSELEQMFPEGRGESPEADERRDRMDRPWYELDDEEAAAIREMPDDLLLNPPMNNGGQTA